MDDLISRQAALEKVRAMQTYKLFKNDDMLLVDKAEVQTELMMLPSVQPEVLACGNGELVATPEPQWILCDERMPEDYVDVLVWFEYFRYGNYNRMCATHGIGNYSKEYNSWTINHETGWKDLHVFAWMPLPEAYKGDEK